MAGIFDGEEFGKTIVEAVNASIDRQLAPLMKRLDVLESAHNDHVAAQDTSSRAFAQKFVSAEKRMEEFVTPDRMDEALKDIRGALESTLMPEMQEALSVRLNCLISLVWLVKPCPRLSLISRSRSRRNFRTSPL
jgi:hypothetical protein